MASKDKGKSHAFINSLLYPTTKARIDLKDEELRNYLHFVGSIPLLSPNEERELLKAAQNGDKPAQQRIIEANLRFVVTIAAKFQAQRFALIDVIQEGNLGLLDAIKGFKLTNPVRFYTYAKFHVFKHIYTVVTETDDLITTPYKVRQQIQSIQKVVEAFLNEGFEPTTEQIALQVGMSKEHIAELLILMQEPLSIERELRTTTIMNQSENPVFLANDLLAPTSALFSDVQRVMSQVLSANERTVLAMRFGLGKDGIVYDYKEIAEVAFGRMKGRADERIRQIEKSAITKVQKAFEQA